MVNKCEKCVKLITDRRILICKLCQSYYHLRCTTVSVSRFYNTLIGEHRDNWKCDSCVKKFHNEVMTKSPSPRSPCKSNNSTPKNNITHRVKQIANVSTENSFQSLSVNSDDEEFEDTLPENDLDLNRSCPESQTLKTYADIEQTKRKIIDLELKLQIAENEIDNLVAENCALKNLNLEKDHKIELLQGLCKSTPTRSTKKLKKININTPKLESTKRKTETLLNELPDESRELKDIETERMQKLQGSPKSIQQHQLHPSNKTPTSKYFRKICILSSEPNHQILKKAEKHFDETLLCHYLTPGGGIHQILSGIETKLEGFTYDDYCLIFIGETDFQVSKNYSKLIDYIREKLLIVQHTNIIICSPTYKYYINLFNKRVEAFNNLLYLDNLNFEYAYLIDSNRHLEYSTYMFNRRNGRINKRALLVIFNDVEELMEGITNYTLEKQQTINPSLEFFR